MTCCAKDRLRSNNALVPPVQEASRCRVAQISPLSGLKMINCMIAEIAMFYFAELDVRERPILAGSRELNRKDQCEPVPIAATDSDALTNALSSVS